MREDAPEIVAGPRILTVMSGNILICCRAHERVLDAELPSELVGYLQVSRQLKAGHAAVYGDDRREGTEFDDPRIDRMN